MTARTLVLLSMLAATASVAGLEVTLDPRAVAEAVTIGQSRSERERERFHAPYRLAVNRPPIDYIEVVTPFRRVVVVAESRARIGQRSFGQRQALAMLAEAPPSVEVRVELTFHPQNTFVGVPDYDVQLEDRAGRRVRPTSVDRIPRYTPRVDETLVILPPDTTTLALPTGPGQPLHGGTVAALFDAQRLDGRAAYDVVIEERGAPMTRVRIDFARLR